MEQMRYKSRISVAFHFITTVAVKRDILADGTNHLYRIVASMTQVPQPRRHTKMQGGSEHPSNCCIAKVQVAATVLCP